MEIGYYPGCSLEGVSKEFDISLRKVCSLLDIKLVEIPDWHCCGTSPLHAFSQGLSYLLPYKNIQKAVEGGIKGILVPCPSCLYSLCFTEEAYKNDGVIKNYLIHNTGFEYTGDLKIYHILDFLRDLVTLEALKNSIKKPLQGLKVVSYYGCLMRFHGVEIDDDEQPTIIDKIVESIGGEPLEWTHKVECCGAGLSITRPGITQRLLRDILDSAKRAGADCVTSVCPLCQSNLDMRQKGLSQASGNGYNMPIVYLTQLIGIALGAHSNELGMDKLMVDFIPTMKEKGLL
jgi:heterodisulfide reductase subunit B2